MRFNSCFPVAVVSFCALLASVSCTKKAEAPSISAGMQPETAPAAGKTLTLAIWSNYVQPELLADFTKRTGYKVQVTNYSSNEELLAKLQAGASGYDVIVPSDYMVFALAKLGLARELDKSKLTNAKAIDARYLGKSYDPQNKFSFPYSWGTTGIAVNHSLYKGEVKSWKQLLTDPALAGKFTLLDDVRETLGAALKAQGFGMNSKDPAQLSKGKAMLIDARKRIKGFTSETKMALINGETPVMHAYMTDALQAAKATGGKVEYVIPSEGATFWVDNLVIPSSAPNVEGAHALINFLLEPTSVAQTVASIMVAPANKEARALLPKDIQSNPMLFPSDEMLKKTEMIEDLGDSLQAWDRIWTEVKAE